MKSTFIAVLQFSPLFVDFALGRAPPDCLTSCWDNSMYVSSCTEIKDVTPCLCEDPEFQSSVLQCIYIQCPATQLASALHFAISYCPGKAIEPAPALLRNPHQKRKIGGHHGDGGPPGYGYGPTPPHYGSASPDHTKAPLPEGFIHNRLSKRAAQGHDDDDAGYAPPPPYYGSLAYAPRPTRGIPSSQWAFAPHHKRHSTVNKEDADAQAALMMPSATVVTPAPEAVAEDKVEADTA
ncbi:hypothetical protein K402DRAFT_458724 [Aulographum hederae CBS 113979]|uniref:CFEM domain-containing protein n=1 Tax=Aulographum hederae CBS 113979 TaxID=1176131 RepID=A0A6G1HGZ9_9PEZI|nr:hypothetical protein K402DRAFT_458724 [Aulographum hederae CBS 113979]